MEEETKSFSQVIKNKETKENVNTASMLHVVQWKRVKQLWFIEIFEIFVFL